MRKKDAACLREMLSSWGWRHVPVGGVGATGRMPSPAAPGAFAGTVVATAGVVRAVEDIFAAYRRRSGGDAVG